MEAKIFLKDYVKETKKGEKQGDKSMTADHYLKLSDAVFDMMDKLLARGRSLRNDEAVSENNHEQAQSVENQINKMTTRNARKRKNVRDFQEHRDLGDTKRSLEDADSSVTKKQVNDREPGESSEVAGSEENDKNGTSGLSNDREYQDSWDIEYMEGFEGMETSSMRTMQNKSGKDGGNPNLCENDIADVVVPGVDIQENQQQQKQQQQQQKQQQQQQQRQAPQQQQLQPQNQQQAQQQHQQQQQKQVQQTGTQDGEGNENAESISEETEEEQSKKNSAPFKELPSPYKCPRTFKLLSELKPNRKLENVIGIVSNFSPATKSKGSDLVMKLNIIDPSYYAHPKEVLFFRRAKHQFPEVHCVGDIVRFHRLKANDYLGELQLISNHATSFLVFPGLTDEDVTVENVRYQSENPSLDEDVVRSVLQLRQWLNLNKEAIKPTEILTLSQVPVNAYCDVVVTAVRAEFHRLPKPKCLIYVCDGSSYDQVAQGDRRLGSYQQGSCADYQLLWDVSNGLDDELLVRLHVCDAHAITLVDMRIAAGQVLILHGVWTAYDEVGALKLILDDNGPELCGITHVRPESALAVTRRFSISGFHAPSFSYTSGPGSKFVLCVPGSTLGRPPDQCNEVVQCDKVAARHGSHHCRTALLLCSANSDELPSD